MQSYSITPELAKWLQVHAADDPDTIRLAGRKIQGYSASFVANQLAARQRFQKKFPKLCADPFIVFPPSLNLEQSSSEHTARIKHEFILEIPSPRNHLIDLTAGFGVDALTFTETFEHVSLVEPDHQLNDLSNHNFDRIAPGKFSSHPQTAEDFLSNNNRRADWIYIDPSRRDKGRRKFLLEETFPNVVDLYPKMLESASHLLIKTSPMLDISACLKALPGIGHVIVISIANECKEVLYHMDNTKQVAEPEIRCINIHNTGQREVFNFFFSQENTETEFAKTIGRYLLEPNASMMKAGGFKSLSKSYGIMAVGVNTRVFTCDKAPLDFPGRVFKVLRPFTKADAGIAAAVISRNYPLTADQIRKKYELKESEKTFLIAFTSKSGKNLVLADRV